MSNPFIDRPILNSPYEYPSRHWELDEAGQPTQRIIESRRRAAFISPIPRARRQPARGGKDAAQTELHQDHDISTARQEYDVTSVINEVCGAVDAWRTLPSPAQWDVTPQGRAPVSAWRHREFRMASAQSDFPGLEPHRYRDDRGEGPWPVEASRWTPLN